MFFFFFFFFFFESTLFTKDCLLFVHCSPPNRTLANMTSFSHAYVSSDLLIILFKLNDALSYIIRFKTEQNKIYLELQ